MLNNSDSSNLPTPAQPGTFVARYAGAIIKNVIGWILILSALLIGGLIPLPLGTPMFFIGFALVTFPGKRRLTSSALRGLPINLRTQNTYLWRTAISLLLPIAIVGILAKKRHPILHPSKMSLLELCTLYAASILAAWILVWLFLLALNAVVRFLPRIRRRVRPWLRRKGINLLPPRPKRRYPAAQ